MLRDRLMELDIKITELASYLNSSRPTIYKYIESFDNGEIDKIPKKILDVLNFINDSQLIDKLNVIDYIISKEKNKKAKPVDFIDIKKRIKKLQTSNPQDQKLEFISNLIDSDQLDFLIPLFKEIYSSIKNYNKSLKEDNEKQEIFKKFQSEFNKLIKEEKIIYEKKD